MDSIVNCLQCHAALQAPQGATWLRCFRCQAVTQIPISPEAQFSALAISNSAAPYPYHHVARSPAGNVQVHGQKRALLCAVSYRGSDSELQGCINDAKCMKYMLMKKFKFPETSILMLNEDETDPHKIPTKQNIRLAMQWLVQGCQHGDSLVFHFSGHGTQKDDRKGHEVDGLNEAICPMDWEDEGHIIDDEINDKIVKPLPHGVKLHAIIDACHSGTVLDLPYLCRLNQEGEFAWEDHQASGPWKGTSGGEAFSFSGCDDHQTSIDTTGLSKVTSTGALTYSFIQAIEQGHGGTYGSILTAMRSTINTFVTSLFEDNSNDGVEASDAANDADAGHEADAGRGDAGADNEAKAGAGNEAEAEAEAEAVAEAEAEADESANAGDEVEEAGNEEVEQTFEIQVPQLTANAIFDVFSKAFSL